jgi:regulator of replication initiation timing
MKITLLLISITLLSACSMQAENTKEIESLKSQINILKNENVTLREENTLLKAGGVPQ